MEVCLRAQSIVVYISPEETRIKSNYGKFYVSTLVKLVSALMVCLCNV